MKKVGETIVVEPAEREPVTVPLGDISELVVAGPVSVTTPTLHELLRRDVPVAWTSSGFWFLGTTGGASPRSGAARAAQYRLANDPTARLAFARELVAAKLKNQRTVLRRNWRGAEDARAEPSDRLEMLVRRARTAPDAAHLLGIEGEGAAIYFRALSMMLGEAARLPFAFERRNRRPPSDPINACLSLAYALLTRTMTTALSTVGLDPWGSTMPSGPAGRRWRSTLMEPYRPLLADSAVLMAINNGEVKGTDFVFAAGGCNLTPAGRRALIAAYERRFDVISTHPTFGYQIEMRRMLTVQARLLVRFLMGEVPTYPHLTPR